MSTWQMVLVEPARAVVAQISQFLVSVLLVIIILIVGWVISKFIKSFVTKALRILKFDELSVRIELDDLLAKGGIKYSLSELIGAICYWLALLVTFVVAINAIGLTIAADLLNQIILYIPNIIAAIFILILGLFVATLLKNIVKTAAANAGIAQENLLANLTEVVVIVFAVAISLQQLEIAADIIKLIIGIVLATAGLGVALAFGLGCKDIAARFAADLVDKMRSRR